MNIEKEVISILSTDFTPEQKAKMIGEFTNFDKEKIIEAVKTITEKGGKASSAYEWLILTK